VGEREFDYIVIGGGSAGCVVARRLAESTQAAVALLEAGPSDEPLEEVLELPRWADLLGGPYDYDYAIEPQSRGNSAMRQSRGKVLGGCSSHNSCIAFVPPDGDLDAWAAAGANGWDARSVRPYFERMLATVHLEPGATTNPFSQDFIRAALEAGHPRADFAAPFDEGVGWFQLNKRGTRRGSASVAYLHPARERPPNLHLVTNMAVRRIVFEGSRAVGVETPTVTLRAAREVILSCGAFDSPKLLMLSGVGPADALREHGIDVVADRPGVGQNLLDHPEGVLTWSLKQPLPDDTVQRYEVGLFTRVDKDAAWPDLMFHLALEVFDRCTKDAFASPEHGFSLTPNVTRARSRGTVALRSANPDDPPRIDFQYFTDPDGYDERIMVASVDIARDIVRQPSLRDWVDEEVFPGEGATPEEVAERMRRYGNTVYHPVGTCKIGAPDASNTVVDPALRVVGVDGLRIADASVFPVHTSVNPNLTVMMVGERCAALVAG